MSKLTETIVTTSSVITAVVMIFGIIFAIYNWYLKQNKQDEDIKELKKEMCLLTYGVLACLKGLSQMHCNGPVTEAKEKLEKHINMKAHDQ